MMYKSLALFLVGVLVLAGGIAVASHVETPPISDGGELAYVRNYAPDALDVAQAGGTVTATYVGWSFDPRSNDDLVLGYSSRGRMADTQVWHHIWVPSGVLSSDLSFRSVGQWDRGMVVASGDAGCLGLLNGVNAGVGYVAKEPSEVRFKTTGHYSVSQVAPDRVELHRDGHVMALQVFGDGTISVDGVNAVVLELGAGSEVRSWIDGGAFPATTQVMHAEFDHLAQECLS
jgi:hypothetical protein